VALLQTQARFSGDGVLDLIVAHAGAPALCPLPCVVLAGGLGGVDAIGATGVVSMVVVCRARALAGRRLLGKPLRGGLQGLRQHADRVVERDLVTKRLLKLPLGEYHVDVLFLLGGVCLWREDKWS
jgi:hypothetical protein